MTLIRDVSEAAEVIVDTLMETPGVDEYELLEYLWDMVTEKTKDKFVESIMGQYELMTFDQAMEAAADAKSI